MAVTASVVMAVSVAAMVVSVAAMAMAVVLGQVAVVTGSGAGSGAVWEQALEMAWAQALDRRAALPATTHCSSPRERPHQHCS